MLIYIEHDTNNMFQFQCFSATYWINVVIAHGIHRYVRYAQSLLGSKNKVVYYYLSGILTKAK